jgi:hypothetical protein
MMRKVLDKLKREEEQRLLEIYNEEFEDTFGIDFTVSYTSIFGENVTANLCDGGKDIPVTYENREDFCVLLEDW